MAGLQPSPRAVSVTGRFFPPKGFKQMNRLLASAAGASLLLVVCHCGSSTYGGTPLNDAGPGSGITLTVDNFDVWCTLTVNGVAQSAAQVQYPFDAGTVVPLDAVANTGFTFAYWLGTDGANSGNGGEDPHAATAVTMTTSKTVLACCNAPTEPCPSSL